MRARVVNVNSHASGFSGGFTHEQVEFTLMSEVKEGNKTTYIPNEGSIVVLVKNEKDTLKLKIGDVVEVSFSKVGN